MLKWLVWRLRMVKPHEEEFCRSEKAMQVEERARNKLYFEE